MLDLPTWADVPLRGLLLTAAIFLWTIFLIRIVGLRSLSKMTSFDFVATIAIGSLIANTGSASSWPEFWQGVAAMAALFLVQWLLAKARQKSEALETVIRNQPVLLMENGAFIDAALAETRVSKDNVYEKLRSNSVCHIEDVRAVVLETTGDISVVKKGADEEMLAGVARH